MGKVVRSMFEKQTIDAIGFDAKFHYSDRMDMIVRINRNRNRSYCHTSFRPTCLPAGGENLEKLLSATGFEAGPSQQAAILLQPVFPDQPFLQGTYLSI